MFASLAARIRLLPMWGQAIAWPFYGFAKLLASMGEMLGALITNSAGSFFGTVVKGSLMEVLAKVAGVILALGLLAVFVGAEGIGGGLIALAAAPIMVLGLVYMAKSAFASPAKKKKKK